MHSMGLASMQAGSKLAFTPSNHQIHSRNRNFIRHNLGIYQKEFFILTRKNNILMKRRLWAFSESSCPSVKTSLSYGNRFNLQEKESEGGTFSK